MKTKLLALIATTVITFLVATGTVCFAETPKITREYIARSVKGVESREEKVTAFYGGLHITQGDYLKVSFLDAEDSVLMEHCIELDIENPSGADISIKPETLSGTEYIEITVCGYSNVYNGVKLPFKIY